MSNRRRIKGNPLSTPSLRRINGYKCEECGRAWLTVDLNEGVTPMFSPCFKTEGCKGRAVSMGYPPGPPPESLGEPLIEWYAPKTLAGLSYELAEHVRRGGLMRRAASHAPDWVKELA